MFFVLSIKYELKAVCEPIKTEMAYTQQAQTFTKCLSLF